MHLSASGLGTPLSGAPLPSPQKLRGGIEFSLPLMERREGLQRRVSSPGPAPLRPQFPHLKYSGLDSKFSIRLISFALELGQQTVPHVLSVLKNLSSLANAILKFLPSIILFFFFLMI